MDTQIKEALAGLTVPVPVAGKALGLGKNAAYRAAKRGEIPTVKIGGAIRVPTAALRRLLQIEEAA